MKNSADHKKACKVTQQAKSFKNQVIKYLKGPEDAV